MTRRHTPESLERRIVRTSADWSCVGLRLIDYLAGRFTYRDAAAWREVIAAGEIMVNHAPASPEQILAMHDLIEYLPRELPEPEAELDYGVLFEDDDLVVVDKPGNLCMHPSGPFFRHTLWHLMCSRSGDIHFINRLDRETSGALIAAKTRAAAAKLQKPGAQIVKTYLVLVMGEFTQELDAAGFLIADTHSEVHKKRRFVTELPEGAAKAESCRTRLVPAGSPAPGFSLVEAMLYTGRMHQIRATMHSLGYPVVGDKLYGPDEKLYLKIRDNELSPEDRAKLILPRQELHSYKIGFNHPRTGERMNFTAPIPAMFADISGVKGR